MSASKYFTVSEANSTVDVIRPIIARILEIRATILERQPQVWTVVEKAAGNGGSQLASEMVMDFNELDSLVHSVQATGALLKDINTGLVDFPAIRDGQEVYLCWRFGEGQILFWHTLESGFQGRQPLE